MYEVELRQCLNPVTLWPTVHVLNVLVRRQIGAETKFSSPATLASTESTYLTAITKVVPAQI